MKLYKYFKMEWGIFYLFFNLVYLSKDDEKQMRTDWNSDEKKIPVSLV